MSARPTPRSAHADPSADRPPRARRFGGGTDWGRTQLETAGDSMSSAKAQIGVTGLAVMGRNLARNLARNGFRVAIHNRSQSRTDALVEEYGNEGEFVPSAELQAFVESLEQPRKIIIM